MYFLVHESQESADRSWKAFVADPDWIKVRDASEADGKILAKAPERTRNRRRSRGGSDSSAWAPTCVPRTWK